MSIRRPSPDLARHTSLNPVARRSGVTLFEAVAAMAIISLTAVAALEAVGAQMRAAERARRAIETSALAQQRLDWLDFLTEQQLRSLPDTVAQGKFDEPLQEYSWKTETSPVSTEPGVYDVKITISWPENAYVLRSYAYRRPVLATRRGAGR